MLDRQLCIFSDVSLQLIQTRNASFTRKNVLNKSYNNLFLLILLFHLPYFFDNLAMFMLKLLHKTPDNLILDPVTDGYLSICQLPTQYSSNYFKLSL